MHIKLELFNHDPHHFIFPMFHQNYEDQTTFETEKPTRVTSEVPIKKPTSSLTRQLVLSKVGDDYFSNAGDGYFSEVGEGYCLDSLGRYYSSIVSWSDPASTIACDYWCLQNPHPNLVGMEILFYQCSCLFSGGIPNGITWYSYNPSGSQSLTRPAVGPIMSTKSFGDGRFCYRYTVSVLL